MRIYLSIVLLMFGVGNIWAAAQSPLSDADPLQKIAARMYYQAPSQSVRRRGGSSEFLFITDSAISQNSDSSKQYGRLVLAVRDASHRVHIVWQYELPCRAIDAVWWSRNSSNDKSAILVTLFDGSGLTFYADGIIPHFWQKFIIDNGNRIFYVDPGRTFFNFLNGHAGDMIFFENNGLLSFDPSNGKQTVLYLLANKFETAAAFVAIQDLDGDGMVEVVTDTSRFIPGKDPVSYPCVMRVSHYKDGKFDEIWHGAPHELIATQSFLFSPSHSRKPFIVTHEEDLGIPKIRHDFLCLYRWDGNKLIQVSALDNTAAPITDRAMITADLDGSGVQKIVAIQAMGVKDLRIVVIAYKNNKFITVWQSAPLRSAPRFGRVADFENTGKQELALLDEGASFLFKKVGNGYTGWEAFRYVPPPPLPPKPFNQRFYLEQRSGIKPADLPRNLLILDDKPMIQVFANSREMNAEYRAQQIQKRIVELAGQMFPPAKIVSRKIGDEDEEPKMEVAAGKVVIITLTESEAKAQGKTLIALADDWASAVRLALITLAKPLK